jgi:hypothetical protein
MMTNTIKKKKKMIIIIIIPFFHQCHHMSLVEFVVSPHGCGRRVTDF